MRARSLGLALALSGLLAAPLLGQLPAVTSAADADRPTREIFGFFVYRDSEYMLHEADYSVLSTVAFATIEALADGSLHTHDDALPTPAWEAWNAPWMDEVIAMAHAAGCKVVLTVDRFAWNAADRATTTQLLSDETARQRLAANIAAEVVARGVDGVNLDFEPIPSAVRYEFVSFVRELRVELDARRPGLQLTFDATARPSSYALGELLAEDAADAVFLMAYPFHNEKSKTAGATAPLGGRRYDVRASVETYLARTTPDKVILGLPYYGFEWSTKTKRAHSETRLGDARYGTPRTQKISEAWALADKKGWRWSSTENIAWTRWRYRACPGCPRTWRQLYFESTRSLGMKYDLVNEMDLLGVGFWKLGNDAGRPKLYNLLRSKFAPH